MCGYRELISLLWREVCPYRCVPLRGAHAETTCLRGTEGGQGIRTVNGIYPSFNGPLNCLAQASRLIEDSHHDYERRMESPQWNDHENTK